MQTMQSVTSEQQVTIRVVPKCILILCQIIGYFPLDYAKNGTNIKLSKRVLLWNATCLTLVIGFSVLGLYLDFTGFLNGKFMLMTSVTGAVGIFLDMLSLNIIALIAFISSVIGYPKYIEMSLLLIKFDRHFHREIQPVSYKWKFSVVMVNMTIILSWSAMRYISINILNAIHTVAIIVYYTQVASFIHFTYVINSIIARFSVINNTIRKELMEEVSSGVDVTSVGGGQTGQRLKLLFKYYLDIYDAAQLASDFFSSQLFAAILSSFFHITTTLYQLFGSLWPNINYANVEMFPLQVFWIFTHSLHLLLLVLPCTAVEKVVADTAPMICGLINKNLRTATIIELESFLVNLLHLKVGFSASGFFTVHSSILTSIMSSITTYLVMFIQFHEQETATNESS